MITLRLKTTIKTSVYKQISIYEKTTFINTCDAMLWARHDGETFGLAIGEFSSKNKPVIYAKVCN